MVDPYAIEKRDDSNKVREKKTPKNEYKNASVLATRGFPIHALTKNGGDKFKWLNKRKIISTTSGWGTHRRGELEKKKTRE